MKKILVLIGIVGFIVSISGIASASIIANGGFGSPDISGQDSVTYNTTTNPVPSIFGWQLADGGNIDLINGYWNGASGAAGDQSVDINFGTIMYQTFETYIGHKYSVSFAYANNPTSNNPNGSSGSTGSFGVLDEAVFLAHSPEYDIEDNEFLLNDNKLVHNTSTFLDMEFSRYNGTFIAASNSTVLGFAGEDKNGDYGFVVDDVSVNEVPVNAVPEPASMSLLGLGLLGFAFKRKKNT